MGEALLQLKTDAALIERLKNVRPLSVEERREQRISWTFGSLSENNTLTREQVRELIEQNA